MAGKKQISNADFFNAPVQGTLKPWQKSPAKLEKPSSCSGCPLVDMSSGFSVPEGKGTIPLLIVAEALGEQEAKDGLPLRPYAPSGSVVEMALKQCGVDRSQVVLWNTIACFPGDTIIEADNVEKAYKRWYEGSMVKVITACNELTGTPNHPVLTQRGWIPLGLLNEGDYLLRSGWSEATVLRNPNIKNEPTKFVELFTSLSQSTVSERVIGSYIDFHGDGSEAEIQVVTTDWFLRNWGQSQFSNHLGEIFFKTPDMNTTPLLAYSTSNKLSLDGLRAAFSASVRGVCFSSDGSSPFRANILKTSHHSLRTVTDVDSTFLEYITEPSLSNAERLGYGFQTLPLKVSFSRVNKIERFSFSGHVYNLQTSTGEYTANGYIVSNCRPPNNQLEGEWYERGAIEHCQTHFDAVVDRFKPKAILSLGNTPLSSLTGFTGKDRTVSSVRGYVLWSERYDVPVIPTYHPSFVRRGGLKLLWVLRHDMAKALHLAKGGKLDYAIINTPDEIRLKTDLMYNVSPSPAELQAWFYSFASNPTTFGSYDIETGYAAAQSEEEREVRGKEVTQIQFSKGIGEGIALPWNQEAAEFSRAFFSLPNPRGNHNAWRFDNKILRLNGIEPAPRGATCHDTMVMWHCYQPDLPAGLQSVAAYFGFPFPWKHFVTQDFGLYGICDVDAVQRIWQGLPEQMKRKVNPETGKSVWDGCLEKFVELQPILTDMQDRGIGVDVPGRIVLQENIREEQKVVMAELQELIPAEVKKRKEWKTWPSECKELVEEYRQDEIAQIKSNLEATGQKVTKKALSLVVKPKDYPEPHRSILTEKLGFKWDGDILYKELDFNPNSSLQLKSLFKFYKVDIPTTLDGDETTGKGELRKLLKKCKNGTVIAVVDKVLQYRELSKVDGTYINGAGWTPDAEGRVHTTFTFKSATWQLTSTEPNIQNIPKHTRLGGEIRKLIVPKPGNVLLEADYSSFHVLTLGFNAQSERYMQLARSDAHSYVTAHMLKTRCKGRDELEIETMEYIRDLDGWLQLPREEFLSKLGWIKKHYGKTLRQQGKAAILGVGLGLGAEKLHSHNEDSFNPTAEEAEHWLGDNPRAMFYSPLARGMKPASYFPRELQVMLAQEKLGKQAAKDVRALVERLFPEVFKWQQQIRQLAARQGYLVSRYGGIRWFHNVFEWDSARGQERPGEDAEAAIAFFVQNDAFGKIREAMLEIQEETQWGQYMVNTVHDSLVFDVPEAMYLDCAKDVAKIMERPAKLLKHPTLCPDGLVCGVEVSVGTNWKDLKEIKL